MSPWGQHPWPMCASFCGWLLHPGPHAAEFTCLGREAVASSDFVSSKVPEYSLVPQKLCRRDGLRDKRPSSAPTGAFAPGPRRGRLGQTRVTWGPSGVPWAGGGGAWVMWDQGHKVTKRHQLRRDDFGHQSQGPKTEAASAFTSLATAGEVFSADFLQIHTHRETGDPLRTTKRDPHGLGSLNSGTSALSRSQQARNPHVQRRFAR